MPKLFYRSALGTLHFCIPIAIKLALAITLLVVSGLSMLGFTILENQKNIMTEQVIGMGTTVATQLANSANEMVLSDDNLGLQTLINNLVDKNNILGAIVLSDKGLAMAKGGTVPGENTIKYQSRKTTEPRQVRYFEWVVNLESDNSHELVTFVTPVHFKNLLAGHVLVTFTKKFMDQSLQESKQVIILITALMTLISIFLAFFMSNHLSKPIHKLVDASKAIGEGNYSFRLNERRNDEIGELATAFNQMADGLLKKSQVENAFSRYVSSSVAKKVMENLESVELGGKHVHASVLFADIVGFTSISENLPPKEIASLLNEYFSYISKISAVYKGHIDKFMGDCAMVVFGVPEHNPNHSFNAVACAVMIQKLVQKLNIQRTKQGKIAVHFRIGINTGNMIAGNLGSDDRMEYTVIGDPVNIASRLSSVASSDQTVIMEELYLQESVKNKIIATMHETISVRGKTKPVSTYFVEELRADYKKSMDETIDKMLLENTTK